MKINDELKQDIQEILQDMQHRRESCHVTQSDIVRIRDARHTGDWTKVHESRLYRLHGGEYCELLEVTCNYFWI